jgi:hypothetical protein
MGVLVFFPFVPLMYRAALSPSTRKELSEANWEKTCVCTYGLASEDP